MRQHFRQLAHGLDTQPLLQALARQPALWNQHPWRTTFPGSPHAAVDDIWLRFNDLRGLTTAADPWALVDGVSSVPYPAWKALSEARTLCAQALAWTNGAQLGRVLITRMTPGGQILPHVDEGQNADYYERFHLVLQGDEGNQFQVEDETCVMQPGECWWFNHHVQHAVRNVGAVERLTLIMDIACNRRAYVA